MDYYQRKRIRAEGDAVLLGKLGAVLAVITIVASCSVRIEHRDDCTPQPEARRG